MRKGRIVRTAALVAIPLLVAVLAVRAARLPAAAAADPCSTANVLSGSNFEIDVNGNLKVDGAGPCIDWLADGTGSALRSGVLTKNDKPSGSGDDAFGQGTAENNANPTIVTGSIPPNKSDLKVFGAFTETSTAKFLELFWSRVQSPQGTTNMDFELNQKFCNPSATPSNCANNGSGVTPETPLRTAGDKLVTYDLSKGGTVPTISIRTWTGSVWGPANVISGGADPLALGSVNTSAIAAADTGGIGSQDPFTFGEAAISFNALFPPGSPCTTLGSAYLKSRSSDSFTSELKDFIAPERVQISNCTTLTTNAAGPVTIGSPISDTAHLSGATTDAGGTITFHLFSDDQCQNEVDTGLSPVAVSGNGDYNSGDFTPTAVGTYFWTASYSGDLNNAGVETACGDANESSVVNKAHPSVTTSATASVTIGSPISDTAHLSGATGDAGGTITFHLFSDDQCQNEVDTGLSPVAVSGNGDYNSGDFTPSAVGTYFWTASYSGDAKNLPVLTACGDPGESSVVGKASSGISTGQEFFPQDTATISAGAGGLPTGSVSFKLFGPDNPTCDADGPSAVYTETVDLTNGSSASTSNTVFKVTSASASTYKWLVVYSGDATHEGATSACGTEQFTLTIVNG
jgi:Cu/Zn superoxide dismutase